MNKHELAHAIAARLMAIEVTHEITDLARAAKAGSPVIHARMRQALDSLPRGTKLPPDLRELIAEFEVLDTDAPGRENRDRVIRVRLRREEYDRLTVNAAEAGVSVSQYVRQKVNQ